MPKCGTSEACDGCSLPYDPDLGWSGNKVYRELGYIAEENKYSSLDEPQLTRAIGRAGLDISTISDSTRQKTRTASTRKANGLCV